MATIRLTAIRLATIRPAGHSSLRQAIAGRWFSAATAASQAMRAGKKPELMSGLRSAP